MTDSAGNPLRPLKEELLHIIDYLRQYLRNPMRAISQVPVWRWPSLILFQVILAAACGFLSGIITGRIMQILLGFIFLPISSTAMIFAFAGFFYYTFLFFFHRRVDFKALFALIVFANIPMMILSILTPLLPALTLVGLAVTGLLLIVGFVDAFGMNRPAILRLIATMYLIFFAFWIFRTIQVAKKTKNLNQITTPESLDILEKELKSHH